MESLVRATWPCSCARLLVFFPTQRRVSSYLVLFPPLCNYYLTLPFSSSSGILSSWGPGSLPISHWGPCRQPKRLTEWRWQPQATCGPCSYTQSFHPRLEETAALLDLASWKGIIESSFITFSELIWYSEECNFCPTEQMHEWKRGDLSLAFLLLRSRDPRFTW